MYECCRAGATKRYRFWMELRAAWFAGKTESLVMLRIVNCVFFTIFLVRWQTLCHAGNGALHSDDDFAEVGGGAEVAVGIGGLVEGEDAVDDGFDFGLI